MNEEEREFYRGNPDDWEPVKARVGKGGVVYSNDGNWPPIRSHGTPARVSWKGEAVDQYLGLK